MYILDARERAKARSLLDPSDQCDAKAFSPPISELGFSISLSEPQLSDLSASANLRLSLPPLKSISYGLRWYCCWSLCWCLCLRFVSTEQQFLER